MMKSRRQADIATLIDLHSGEAARAIEKLRQPFVPPEARRPAHVQGCACMDCWNAGQRYADYLKARRLSEL
jgi:hypothetical protein